MRLAIVGPTKPWRGGIALHTAAMAAAARGAGHSTIVVSYQRLYPRALFPGRSQLEPGAAPPDAADASTPPILDTLWPPSWWRAGRAARAFEPDLTLVQRWHPFFQPALSAVANLARRGGSRVVWMVHNAEPHEGLAALWRPVATLGMHGDDTYLTHAESEAERLRALGVRGRVITVPHPAPERMSVRPDPAAARRELGLPRDATVFLFFGYVRRYKGVDILLDALGRLAEEGPPWCALIAGEWYVDRAQADQAIARPPLAERVRILDRFIPEHEVATLFAAADAVVLPYRDGTQSGVVPLAYAHGRPVVATAVGGIPAAVRDGETGLLVAPGDVGALAAALDRVRRGQHFSGGALDDALRAASWAAFVDALVDIARVRVRAGAVA